MLREWITPDDLKIFKTELLDELEVRLVKKIQPQKEILRSAEVRKLLNISAGTLQHWRICGTLPYIKVQGMIFYRYADILKLLERNESNRQSKTVIITFTSCAKRNKQQHAEAWASYLQSSEWKYFFTPTTPYELTLPSARRMMVRFQDRITEHIFNGNKPCIFFVAEKFKCKDGFHCHALLDYNIDWVTFPAYIEPKLYESFQIITGARNLTKCHKYRVDFRKYDKNRDAGIYCTKDFLKRSIDYDLL